MEASVLSDKLVKAIRWIHPIGKLLGQMNTARLGDTTASGDVLGLMGCKHQKGVLVMPVVVSLKEKAGYC